MKIGKNKILLAQPIIQDPVFAGKAIFLLTHGKNGSNGIIINATMMGCVGAAEIRSLIPGIPEDRITPAPIYLGGPCNLNSGVIFVHGYEEYANDVDPDDKILEAHGDPIPSFTIMKGMYYGTPCTFAKIIQEKAGDKYRFFSGQAAWAEGQLEHEIGMGAWKVVEGTPELFFDIEKVTKLLRRRYGMSHFMEMLEPQMN